MYDRYFRARYRDYASVWTSTTDNAGTDVAMRAFIAYLSATPGREPRRRASGSARCTPAGATQQLAHAQKTWRNFLDDGSGDSGSDYYWGSNAVTLQTIAMIATGRPGDRRRFFDIELVKAARAQLNYVLGVNPLRKSYVTGFGADSASRIFSAHLQQRRRTRAAARHPGRGPEPVPGLALLALLRQVLRRHEHRLDGVRARDLLQREPRLRARPG